MLYNFALFKFQWDIAHNSKAGEDEFEDAEEVMSNDCPAPKPTKKGNKEGQVTTTISTRTHSIDPMISVYTSVDCSEKWYYYVDNDEDYKTGWYSSKEYAKIPKVRGLMYTVAIICGDIRMYKEGAVMKDYTEDQIIYKLEYIQNEIASGKLDESFFDIIIEQSSVYEEICKKAHFNSASGVITPVYIELDILLAASTGAFIFRI